MEKATWEMKEDFIFLPSAGVPTGVHALKVTPQFTEERTRDAVRLIGIYHIAATVVFVDGVPSNQHSHSMVLIDDMDREDNRGYFEYAVPLHIDLPAEAMSPFRVHTLSSRCVADHMGRITIIWDVECLYRKESPMTMTENPSKTSMFVSEKFKVATKRDESSVLSSTESSSSSTGKSESSSSSSSMNESSSSSTSSMNESSSSSSSSSSMNESAMIDSSHEAEVHIRHSAEESTSLRSSDEIIGFLVNLDDGYTTNLFRSNDVTVKAKS